MPAQRTDSGLRLLQLLAGAFLLWLVTTVGALFVLDREPESVALRAAMVAVAVGGVLPWSWVVARLIQREDEFTRRLHLIALAIAFAITALLVFTAVFLQRAGFIDYVSLKTVLLTMVVTWWLAIIVTKRYYR